ncbi:MAG: DUF4159 domain-containing protein [Myxococcota bacterium]
MTTRGRGERRRRRVLAALGGALAVSGLEAVLGVSPDAQAFGEDGAFNPRILLTGTASWTGRRASAPARWALEVVRRTSAPARLSPTVVRADASALLREPFAIWTGARAPEALTRSEQLGLRRFLALGGVLFVDDQAPEDGSFLRGAAQQIKRVLPRGSPIEIGEDNVVFRSFYLLPEAAGRVRTSTVLKAVVRGGLAQVIFSPNDVLGALARNAGGVHPFDVEGGEATREQAVRLAVNIAMFVLCSNYKDDQVHAPFLMRRRTSGRP